MIQVARTLPSYDGYDEDPLPEHIEFCEAFRKAIEEGLK
jgi:hypothetical protein